MKKIVINLLAIGLIGASIVACSSGSSSQGPGGPAAPVASTISPPNGFKIPTDSTSGAAFNLAGDQIAVPGASGYTVLAIPTDVVNAIIAAGGTGATKLTASGGNILISMPLTADETLTYVLTPLAQATQSKALQAVATSAESFNYPTNAVTPVISVGATSLTPAGLAFGYSLLGDTGVAIIAPNPSSARKYTSLTTCSGASGIPSAISATLTQGVSYIALGTQAGSVCVLSGATAQFTNLSAQAPAGKYTAGNVNSFGFPASLNTGNTLVGYWTVSSGIYRVTGTYVNGTPTGNGFLNTTLADPQETTNGTTKVTFTGFPSPSAISSSYTDSVGNLWVGTNTGAIYVLRTGATQWTTLQLTGATGTVTVQYNGATSGTTATTLIGVEAQSFAVN
ncbi:MAG TPA: hypothetical protein DHV02_00985 [Neisseriales bacterium]|nr:hypothetical protein [Neisseriales bacterium]